ncbi:MAG: glutamate racemase [Clostridia bacterium]|nr:glutamate racemase [Clostridia bacterium]
MKKKWVLVYDSGVGGLSTLVECEKKVSGVDFLYFADNKNCPYGNMSKKQITDLVIRNIKSLLIKYDILAILLACNTVTACCVSELRKILSIPIIGIEPAVLPAVRRSKSKQILVLATNATLRQEKYEQLLAKTDATVVSIGLENLAKDIEKYYLQGVSFNKAYYISKINEVLEKNPQIDKIVLGCTHYSHIKNMLQKEIGLTCFDGNLGVAKRLKNIIGCNINAEKKTNIIKMVLSKPNLEIKRAYQKAYKRLKNQEK